MTYVISNPGSGPVGGKRSQRNADRNMRKLTEDAGAVGATFERDGAVDDTGRYPYVIKLGRRKVAVDMPGLPLDRVRFMNEPGQNAWHFPRLYVDGSSWLWEFARGFVRRGLGLPAEHDDSGNWTWSTSP